MRKSGDHVGDLPPASQKTPQAVPSVSQRSERVGLALVLVPAALTVALVVAGIVTRDMQGARDPAVSGVETSVETHSDYVEGTVDYPQTPATGRAPAPVRQDCGLYEKPVAAETAVHSPVHGVVRITHDPELAGVERFMRRFIQGPPTSVPGVPCSGGTGERVE